MRLVHRLWARRVARLALPALYQRASVPVVDRDARILATAHALGPGADPEFVDDSSTILSVATYMAYRYGELDPTVVERLHLGTQAAKGQQLVARCSLQIWRPPVDAADEWYAHEIAYRGVAHQFSEPQDQASFSREFEEQAKAPKESYARRLGLLSVDIIAWKRWRTLPDLSIVVGAS